MRALVRFGFIAFYAGVIAFFEYALVGTSYRFREWLWSPTSWGLAIGMGLIGGVGLACAAYWGDRLLRLPRVPWKDGHAAWRRPRHPRKGQVGGMAIMFAGLLAIDVGITFFVRSWWWPIVAFVAAGAMLIGLLVFLEQSEKIRTSVVDVSHHG
ncbi:MAG: hypothetical protein JRN35_05100 [Nitrososphaerota archaeon]|nr:hypothetical protein [Nitrososphaerota archaeon]